MKNQLELLTHFFNLFLSPDSCLVDADGNIIAARSTYGETLGTLPIAINNSIRYFPMKDKDVIFLNDPFSGGHLLNHFVFITLIHSGDYPIYWAHSVSTDEALIPASNIDEEGLRIPPTPIRTNQNINYEMIQIIAQHPLASKKIKTLIEQQVALIDQKINQWRKLEKYKLISFNKPLIKELLLRSKKLFEKNIHDGPHGECRNEDITYEGEILKTKIKIHNDQIFFDFTGTSAGKNLFLTEYAALGFCFQAAHNFYKIPVYNSGTFSVLQITKPVGSFMLAKYPSSTTRGITEGGPFVKNAIFKVLHTLHTHKNSLTNYEIPLCLNVRSSNCEIGTVSLHMPSFLIMSDRFSITKFERQFSLIVHALQYSPEQGVSIQIEIIDEDSSVQWHGNCNPEFEKRGVIKTSAQIYNLNSFKPTH